MIELVEDPISAHSLLRAAGKHMQDRASTYDKPEGERSMSKTVEVFNCFHGTNLTEAQGWHFMAILKGVRLFARESFHADSAEDLCAYSALMGEAKAAEDITTAFHEVKNPTPEDTPIESLEKPDRKWTEWFTRLPGGPIPALSDNTLVQYYREDGVAMECRAGDLVWETGRASCGIGISPVLRYRIRIS